MFSIGEMYLIFKDIKEYISVSYLVSFIYLYGGERYRKPETLEEYLNLLTDKEYLKFIEFVLNDSTPRELALFSMVLFDLPALTDTSLNIEELKEQYNIIKDISHHSDGIVALFIYIIKSHFFN